MRVLLIHKGFPGQFKHLFLKLQQRGHEISVISKPKPKTLIPKGIAYTQYSIKKGNSPDVNKFCREFETKIIRGEAVAKCADKLKSTGYYPDLILGHPGWGEMLFLRDIWPRCPQIHYLEFFYGVPGTDNDFEESMQRPLNWEERAYTRIKNAHLLSNMNSMEAGLTPTYFQHSLLPEWVKACTQVIHDGIDCDWLSPNNQARLIFKNGFILRSGMPIVTFINRTFEPYRGIHVFLESIKELQRLHSTFHTILVGEDTPFVSYGKSRTDGAGWLTILKKEYGPGLDWSRIHAVGKVTHTQLKTIYQISSAHVYLSYPFVLSWSMLEAMSCGCLVIGSDTAPVRELIKNGKNGILVPFSDAKQIKEQIHQALLYPSRYLAIKKEARRSIQDGYNLIDCINKQVTFLESFA